ncbi:MAG: hypothetical protein JNL34_07805 [Anaerolineae bacterium]|nr:hypothetical protein [Anaerolineae bacterium]
MPDRLPTTHTPLTPRERDILRLLGQGLSGAEIAGQLVVSPQTVKWYLKEIYSKLGVHSRDEALALVEAEFPPEVEAAAPTPHNLPTATTPLIGRERELTALRALLRDPAVRLVTLLGTPGIGKTRLSVETAHRLIRDFPGGVAFAALAPLSDPALVVDVIARALGLEADGSAPMEDRIKYFLRARRALLVLDNFEHLLDAAPLVGELLAAAPGLTVLATSREPLRVYGETEYAVQPLDAATDAVTLFTERAQAVRHDFELTADNAVTVTAICQRLDGLPLAIELAAARMRLYTPHALLGRLASRLNFLTGGSRDVSARQQTLRAAITWSYDLLTADEQQMFARFSVFDGGASLEAFAAVCGAGLTLDPYDGLESLVSKSLIQRTAGADGEPRFSMYEALIEFAAEQLTASGEVSEIQVAHARYFLELAAAYGDTFRMPNELWGLRGFETEYTNIRAAWLFAAAQPGDDLIGLAARRWYRMYTQIGRVQDGALLYETALHSHIEDDTRVAADLMIGYAAMVIILDDQTTSLRLTKRALEIYERLDDADGIVCALINLCFDETLRADPDEAERLQLRTQSIAEQHGVSRYNDSLRMNLAIVEFDRRNFDRGRSLLEAHLADVRQRGIRSAEAWLCHNLVHVSLELGDMDGAHSHAEAGLAAAQAVGMRRKAGDLSSQIAMLAFLGGDLERAREFIVQALEYDVYAGIRRAIGEDHGMLAAIEARLGHLDEARFHWAEAARKFPEDPNMPGTAWYIISALAPALFVAPALGKPALAAEIARAVYSHPETNVWVTRTVEIARPLLLAELGDEAFAAAWERGAGWSLDELMAAARLVDVSGQ